MIEKIKNFFDERFDRENLHLFSRSIIVIFLLIVAFNFIRITLSRYTTEVEVDLSPKIAFFIADVGRYEDGFKLDSILPRRDPYYYYFTVSNFQGDQKANVDIEYEIELRLTTNLPLSIRVFKNTTDFAGPGIVNSDELITNDDGMYFRLMKTDVTGSLSFRDQATDTFILFVEFPESYGIFPDEYAGLIDLVEVRIVAKQAI